MLTRQKLFFIVIGWIKRFAVLFFVLMFLTGCETVGSWFERDEYDPKKPVELTKIDEKVNLDKRWSRSVGNGQGDSLYRITPLLDDGVVYVASSDGEIAAFRASNGDRVLDVELELSISGGVGKYSDSLFLGGADGVVLRLSAVDGSEIWRAGVSGEVLSAPQSNGRVVVTQTYDGKVYGFDYATGEQLWVYLGDVPVLTLRGTSTPIIDNNIVIVGFANGKVLALSLDDGSVVWETRLVISQGRSEIERIVDIDGTMAVQGLELYVAGYKGRVVAMDIRTGRKLWQQSASSVFGVSVGFGNVYVADENGTISAFLRNGQGLRWQNIDLGYRKLSRPIPVSSYVVVADFEGYLHVLSQVEGEIVGRVRLGNGGARADMITDDNGLYVYGDSGEFVAYDVKTLN